MIKRNERLINAKITQYLLPGILMTMALQLGNIVDTILVGNILGTDAMAAISLALPAETVIQIPGYVLGVGGSIAAGILLGKRDKKGASEIFSTTMLITLIAGIIFAAAGAFLSYPLASLLAKGGNLTMPAGDYLLVSFLGAPVIGAGLLMMSFLGVDNHPNLSSAYLIVSNVVNLILDYVLLKYTSLGTTGASLSTVLGFLAGMAVFIVYIRSEKRMISFRFRVSGAYFKEAFVTGVPVLVFMGMTFVKTLGLNFIILSFLGDNGLAVYTICENVLMIVEMLTGGIIGVVPNIAGVLYGEKDYFGIRALCSRIIRYSLIATFVIVTLIAVFPSQVTALFGVADEELLAVTAASLRLFMLCPAFYVWSKFLTGYYECIERSKLASLITFLQNGVFILPAAWIGIYIGIHTGGSGFSAMALSYVASEALTVLTVFIFRRIKYKTSSFYLIPDSDPDCILDMTIKAEMSGLSEVPVQVRKALTDSKITKLDANKIAVAAEEMAANCIRYGGKKSHWIDLSVVHSEGKLLLRIRDNGKPFDPSEYKYDKDDFDSIHGIELVKALASEINYIRTMDMNNTIISFNR